MRFSKIYSNDSRFKSIIFKNTRGINSIIAITNKPHSIGKTTLFKLIDYCLLKGDKPKFLKQKVFENFTFYLELELELDFDKYVTIKRSINGRANTCIKVSNSSINCLDLRDSDFDFRGSDSKALDFLNKLFNFSINSKSINNFRKYINYFLRNKDDFNHPFMLNKFKRGKDVEWKSTVAFLLNINEEYVRKKHNLEIKIEKLNDNINFLEKNENYTLSDIEVMRETINLLMEDLKVKEDLYDNFDFYLKENNINKELVEEIEGSISNLNQERYSITKKLQLIEKSLQREQEINLNKVKKLFESVNIKLNDMLVKSYEDVIDFNKNITKDREKYLKLEKENIEKRVEDIENLLKKNNEDRKKLLSTLKETDTFSKFKVIEKDIVDMKMKIDSAENRLFSLREYKCKLKRLKLLKHRKDKIISKIDNSIKHSNHKLENIKDIFKELSKLVFGTEAILTVTLNSHDNLEFETKIIDTKKLSENTKEEGEAFSRMFCFIFDASIALTYKNDTFFHFIAHDGLFDGLGDEYKNGLIDVINILKKNNIQYIFTSIEDEITNTSFLNQCKSDYLIKKLADNDQDRLFAMGVF